MKIERKTGIDPVFCSEFFDIFGELPLDRMFFSHSNEIEKIGSVEILFCSVETHMNR